MVTFHSMQKKRERVKVDVQKERKNRGTDGRELRDHIASEKKGPERCLTPESFLVPGSCLLAKWLVQDSAKTGFRSMRESEFQDSCKRHQKMHSFFPWMVWHEDVKCAKNSRIWSSAKTLQ